MDFRHHPVLASVSRSYSEPKGRFPRVTHPCATIPERIVRLACIRHAASVRSEPGSNSQVDFRCELEPGSRKTRTRTAPDDKSFIPHIFKRVASDARKRKLHGRSNTPAEPPPAHPFLFHFSKNTTARTRRSGPRKTREGKENRSFPRLRGSAAYRVGQGACQTYFSAALHPGEEAAHRGSGPSGPNRGETPHRFGSSATSSATA